MTFVNDDHSIVLDKWFDSIFIQTRLDEGGNLCFQFRGQGKESEHLAAATANEKEAKIARVKELHEQGKSQTDIARELGISQPTIWRIIQSFSPKPSE